MVGWLQLATVALAVPPYGISEYDYLDSLALTSYDMVGDRYPEVESEGAPAVAWVRSEDPRTLKVTFENPLAIAHSADLFVGDGWFIRNPLDPTTWEALTVIPDMTKVGFPPSGSATVEFSIRGLPNQVDKGVLTFPLELESEFTGLVGSMTEDVFLTLNTPVDTQDTVWMGVLYDTCSWSRGSMTEQDVAWSNTFGIFYNLGSAYNGFPGYTISLGFPEPLDIQHFRIVRFFRDRRTPSVWMFTNCSDIANYLQICNDSQGIQSAPIALRPDPEVGMITHRIRPIGLFDPTNYAEYFQQAWVFHQILHLDGVYDASAAQWKSPDNLTYANPPCAWSMQEYWQNQTIFPFYEDDYGNLSNFLGLIRKYTPTYAPNGEQVQKTEIPVLLYLNLDYV